MRQLVSPGAVRRSFWTSFVTTALVLALLGTGILPGVSTSASRVLAAGAHVKMGGTVTIDNVSGGLWTCGFSPFNPSTNGLSNGIIYEPLVFINQITGQQTPWLASSYSWGNGSKTLTFTIRNGVKWSDGKPLTAADVAFTFNLMKKFSGIDLQAVWTVLSSVKQNGNKVVFTFKKPAVPFFFYIADQNYILPQHIWSKISNPVTYVDKNPVGSGPFVMSQCSPQNITYNRNPHYWQPGKPYISQVKYPAFMDNQPGNLFLAEGKAQWGGQYIPNIQAYYISRDPANRHYWFPPAANVDLFVNRTVAPVGNNVLVRQALSYAIDRNRVSRIGVYGYLPPANQSGIVTPNFAKWYDRSLAQKYNYSYNPAKAKALLIKAGYKMGSNGFFTKGGKTLSLSAINVGGFTDWVAENEIIRDNLRAVGINYSVENLSQTTYNSRLQEGKFQLAYGDVSGGPNPYYELRAILDSANTAPIGTAAPSNYGRYRNPYVDQQLNNFATTTSFAQQRKYMSNIQRVMLTDIPYIPVLENVNWYQYDTTQFTGWPTKQNPYASPAPYNLPDWEVVLLRLHLK
jgi:peptide/nickel transport system substrate-binding protein